eukprot:245162-Chlamydomonas_euryale.AAC.1
MQRLGLIGSGRGYATFGIELYACALALPPSRPCTHTLWPKHSEHVRYAPLHTQLPFTPRSRSHSLPLHTLHAQRPLTPCAHSPTATLCTQRLVTFCARSYSEPVISSTAVVTLRDGIAEIAAMGSCSSGFCSGGRGGDEGCGGGGDNSSIGGGSEAVVGSGGGGGGRIGASPARLVNNCSVPPTAKCLAPNCPTARPVSGGSGGKRCASSELAGTAASGPCTLAGSGGGSGGDGTVVPLGPSTSDL